jgi:hypothetical protein
MAKLPESRDLPTSTEGYERARVDEAFAEFAERVHELESVAAELRAELRTLRAERVAAAAPARIEHESWPGTGFAPSPDWIAAVPAPVPHGLRVPRVALEAAFLLLVGLLAGLADLSAARIVLVMAVAWVLVALAEWAAAAKRARWHLDEIAPPYEASDTAADESTGPWDIPVVETTVVDESASESKTVVTKLPGAQSAAEEPVEAEPAAEPERRGRWRRRRSPTEPGAADPREA